MRRNINFVILLILGLLTASENPNNQVVNPTLKLAFGPNLTETKSDERKDEYQPHKLIFDAPNEYASGKDLNYHENPSEPIKKTYLPAVLEIKTEDEITFDLNVEIGEN